MPMMPITVTSSSSVNPASVRRRSPVMVFGPVEAFARRLRVDVPDVVAAPGVAVGIVLDAAQPPLGGSRHRIDRDPAQELLLLAGSAAHVDALHEHLEVGREVLAVELEIGAAHGAGLDGSLVLVER